MKICIFLIILLGFIRVSFCCQPLNDTEDHECPVTWFRRKRADGEYTRWRSNMETTAEFIVKVLDDDLPMGPTTKLAGVNIQPVTKRGERIIVGGAVVPSPTTASMDQPREYTRFIPPTATRTDAGAGLPYLTPAYNALRKDLPFAPLPPMRNPNRDESPPGSPQFLPRTPPQLPAYTRQVALIAPVSFTRRPTDMPLTPPLFGPYNQPTRTPPPNPTRTVGLIDKLEKLDAFPIFDALVPDDDNQLVITRSTSAQRPLPTQSYMKTEILDEELDHYFGKLTVQQDQGSTPQMLTENFNKLTEFDEKELNQIKDNADSENDTNSYNTFFYTDYRENNSTNELDISRRIEDVDKLTENASITDFHKDNVDISNTKAVADSVGTDSMPVVQNDTADDIFVNLPNDKVMITHNSTSLASTDDRPQFRVESIDKKRPVCNLIKLRPLSFTSPRTLPEIVDLLKQWTEDSPVAKWYDMTGGNLTTMENPIYIMKVDDPRGGQVTSQKQDVLLISGINGRDHHAVSSALYVLYQLIERSETHKDLLSKYRFWVVPVFNPDGYDYSMTFPQRRDWLKNLRQTWEPCKGRESCRHCATHGIRCTVSPCYGVNLDRNFEYQWISPDELHAEQPCGNLYAGRRQMSEVESQALNNFVHAQHITCSMFIAFKEGAVLGVLYPYSHTKKRRAFDQIYRQRAAHAATAASIITDRKYIAGQNSEFLPLYAGGIEDWADGHLGIDNTYTVMMFRPSDMPHSKFLAEKVIHEAYAAMDSLLMSYTPIQAQPLSLTRNKASSPHPNMIALLLTNLASFIFSQYICLQHNYNAYLHR